MEWSSKINLGNIGITIDHHQHILCLGSCFADEIGQRLIDRKFKVVCNPAGVIYNPVSLETLLLYFSEQLTWSKEDAIQIQDMWYSWDHHGKVRGDSFEDLEKSISQLHADIRIELTKLDVVIITLGSAWIYELAGKDRVVANCHKAPSSFFTKKLLDIEKCCSAMSNMVNTIQQFAPDSKILWTLSPVRHLRDGVHENQLSKAILLLAIDQMVQHNTNNFYFPSYEIVLDELRDYRFYKSDFMHLTEDATNYVFDQFESWCMDQSTIQINQEVQKLNQALNHKPKYPNKASELKWESHINDLKASLQMSYPFLNI